MRPYLESLRGVIAERKRGIAIPSAILARLVDDLTSEPAAGTLASAMEASVHVGEPNGRVDGASAGLGTFADREWVLNKLADEALRLVDQDAGSARQYARACFVLAAEEGLLAANIVPTIWMTKRNGLSELAGLSPVEALAPGPIKSGEQEF